MSGEYRSHRDSANEASRENTSEIIHTDPPPGNRLLMLGPAPLSRPESFSVVGRLTAGSMTALTCNHGNSLEEWLHYQVTLASLERTEKSSLGGLC